MCSILYAKGIVPTMICPGPLLDHKALEASGEFNKKDVLLVNFGAKSTNLISKRHQDFL